MYVREKLTNQMIMVNFTRIAPGTSSVAVDSPAEHAAKRG